MDTLTFGTPILLKHLTFSEAKKMPVHEVNLKKALEGLNMEMDQVRSHNSLSLQSLFDDIVILQLKVHRPMYLAGLRLYGIDQRNWTKDGPEAAT